MSSKTDAKTTVHVLPGVMNLFKDRFKQSKKLKTIWTAAAWMVLQASEAEIHEAYEKAKSAHDADGLGQRLESALQRAGREPEAQSPARRQKAGGKGSAA